MSDGAPVRDLLARAWDRLWRPAGLGVLALPDSGPIPLALSETWGPISIAIAELRLAGLAAPAGAGAVEYAPGGTFAATIDLPAVTLSARCTVQTGAAPRGARSLLEALGGADGEAEDGNVELARSYREALLASGRGAPLVASYYDNNDAFDEVLVGDAAPNAFTSAWREHETAPVVTQTASAARRPQELTVGEPAYRTHAGVLQFTLVKVLLGLSREANDRYARAAAATAEFRRRVDEPHEAPQGSVTVATVMAALEATPPSTPGIAPIEPAAAAPAAPAADAVDPAELTARARAIVDERYPHWEAQAAAERAQREADRAAAARSVSTRLHATFALPPLTLAGTAAAVPARAPPQQPPARLRIAATAVELALPRLRPQLSAPVDPRTRGLLAAAGHAFADAAWLHDALAARVRARLRAPDVLDALAGRMERTIDELREAGG